MKRSNVAEPERAVSRRATQLAAELQASLTTHQRLAVLRKMQQFLVAADSCTLSSANSDSGVVYRCLASARVDEILVLQLNHVVLQKDAHPMEVQELCSMLLLILRHCPDDHAWCPRSTSVMVDALKMGVVGPVLAILHLVSTRPLMALEMVKSRQLMLNLIETLDVPAKEEEHLLDGLGCLKNLTCYAEGHRCQLLSPNWIKGGLCNLALTVRSDKARERVSAVFRNLSISPDCQKLITGDPCVLSAVVHLSRYSDNAPLLRNLLNTLITISIEHDACVLLLFHEDGILLNRLNEWLHNDDTSVRKRASRILRHMANELSAPLLVDDAELMESLSCRALQDSNQGVRVEAMEAFARCASLVKSGQPHYMAVLDALLRLTKSPHASSETLARALREQAKHAGNRVPIAMCLELVEAVAGIASARDSSLRAKEDICVALLDLSHESTNLERLSNPHVLDALVQNVKAIGSEQYEVIQQVSIDTLVRLASCATNRTKMVNHHCLLQCLVQYAAHTSDLESKRQVKMVIMSLVGEL
jgi:hypothetical protein